VKEEAKIYLAKLGVDDNEVTKQAQSLAEEIRQPRAAGSQRESGRFIRVCRQYVKQELRKFGTGAGNRFNRAETNCTETKT
jgi:hypothetical protein